MEIQVLASDRHKNVIGLKQLMYFTVHVTGSNMYILKISKNFTSTSKLDTDFFVILEGSNNLISVREGFHKKKKWAECKSAEKNNCKQKWSMQEIKKIYMWDIIPQEIKIQFADVVKKIFKF